MKSLRVSGVTSFFYIAIFLILNGCAHLKIDKRNIGRHFLEGLNGRNYAQVLDDVRNNRIGGVVFYSSAYNSTQDLKNLIAELQGNSSVPLIFSIDGEGGNVVRLGDLKALSALQMGSSGTRITVAESEKIASHLKDVGINLNLAPVLDICGSSNSTIRIQERCFSKSPTEITERASEFISAHQKSEVKTTLKHFPGLGSAVLDSHFVPVNLTDSWRATDLQPYRDLIAKGYNGAIMTGHILNRNLDPNLPASLSKLTTTDLLRKNLNFKGVIITDDLQMGAIQQNFDTAKAAQLALEAGADLVIIGQQFRNENIQTLIENLNPAFLNSQILLDSTTRLQKFF